MYYKMYYTYSDDSPNFLKFKKSACIYTKAI